MESNIKEFIDIHQHCLLSATSNDLEQLHIKVPQINNLNDLTTFTKKNINKLYKNTKNIEFLFESNIQNCIKNNVLYISTSLDYTLLDNFKDVNQFIGTFHKLQDEYFSKIKICFELGISRNNFKPEHFEKIIKLIETKFFIAIDLYGDENLGEHRLIKKIYKVARKNNLILKSHIGEFKNGKEVKKLYKKLHLNEIQHGISIALNVSLLKYFSKKNVVFNICPTSNKILRKVDYSNCCAKIFYNYGVKFTIASDDYLFFNASVKDEYYNLYKSNIFNIEELKKINDFSLKYFKTVYLK